MNLKDIRSKTGSISDYLGIILFLFGWNIVNDVYPIIIPESTGLTYQFVSIGFRLLVGPIILAIVFGGIFERQSNHDELERKSLFSQIKMHALRFIGACFLSLIFYYVVLFISLITAGSDAIKVDSGNLFLAIVTALSSTLMLFWYSAIVVEQKLFRSLGHAIRTLLFNPVALIIGILWFVVCVADSFAFDPSRQQVPLAINIARSGVFAVLKTLAAMYILVIYNNTWGSKIQRNRADEILVGSSKSQPKEGLAKAGLVFSFFSFLPLLHLVALILGIVSLKRYHRFILKAAIACCVGGFFTILYALLVAGYFVGQPAAIRMPDYSFLAESKSEMQPIVDLLDHGDYENVGTQLGESTVGSSSGDWNRDAALAISKYQDRDLDGALKDFYSALQKKPDRSEFYFYYGLALLENDNTEMARQQFQLALEHDPKLEVAERYMGLVQNIYQPSVIGSALMYLVILFFLFTVHEYGHAFAAWKLGDDTAKNLGRLTLNPVAHLDLFGSIILPAILLFQQSSIFFGWAKPVPVDPRNFKNPEKDHMLVSFAGPAVNLLVAMVCMILLVLFVLLTRLLWPETVSLNLVSPFSSTAIVGPPFSKEILFIVVFIKQMFYTSLILGFFNLLPIPPLDGSWILEGLLPQGLRGIFEYVRRFGFMLFILLTLTPVFDYFLGIPIGIAWIGLRWIASAMGFA
jgi:Zn-dependent protease